MEIIDRYVYAVTRQLPKERKEEAAKEIKSLIYQRIKGYAEDITEEEKAKRVIEALGSPDQLADQYRGKERYLIGPKYFTKYLFVLKAVLLAILLGVTIGFFMKELGSDESIVSLLTSFIATVISALLQGAAWITVMFAIFEYKNVDLGKESSWSVKELPELPRKKALISRGESIFTILFAGIFFSVLYMMPEWIGIYYKSHDGWGSIPVFNISVLKDYTMLILLIFMTIIMQESLKILWGKWTGKRAVISAIISLVSGILTIMVFANKRIWNSKVFEYQSTGFEMNAIVNTIVLIIVGITLVEMATDLYKGFKYGD